MLIRAFKTSRLFPLILLVILSAGMWIISKSVSYRVVEPNGMPLYDLVTYALGFLPDWAGLFIGFILVTTQAFHLNLVLNKHEVLYKSSWLPSLLYLFMAGLLPPFLWMHPLLFVNSILIFVLDRLFSLYKNPSPLSLAFDSAFLLSLSALFYLPAVILFLFYFLCMIILRPFSWREWMAGIMGMFLPFFFAFLYYFLNDELLSFYERVFISGIKRQIDLSHFFNVEYTLSISLVGIYFILSMLRLQTNYYKNVTKARLVQQLLVLMIPVCLLSVLVSRDELLFRFNTLAIPFSVYLSYYFMSGKKAWVMELMFLLLVGGWVYNYFVV
ncbi:MAG: hypothetical protein IPJ86_17475 [Bacteroidetes bacterium]|nr:hypothetical protein [Bacteroidota bacterium]